MKEVLSPKDDAKAVEIYTKFKDAVDDGRQAQSDIARSERNREYARDLIGDTPLAGMYVRLSGEYDLSSDEAGDRFRSAMTDQEQAIKEGEKHLQEHTDEYIETARREAKM